MFLVPVSPFVSRGAKIAFFIIRQILRTVCRKVANIVGFDHDMCFCEVLHADGANTWKNCIKYSREYQIADLDSNAFKRHERTVENNNALSGFERKRSHTCDWDPWHRSPFSMCCGSFSSDENFQLKLRFKRDRHRSDVERNVRRRRETGCAKRCCDSGESLEGVSSDEQTSRGAGSDSWIFVVVCNFSSERTTAVLLRSTAAN